LDRLLLGTLLTCRELYLQYCPLLEGVNLERGDWNVVHWVKSVYKEHKRLPTWAELKARYPEFGPEQNIPDLTIIEKGIIDFIKEDRLKDWLIKVANKIETKKVDYLEIFGEMREMVRKYDVSESAYRDAEKVWGDVLDKMVYSEQNIRISTGVKKLDDVLSGGVGLGEIMILIAPSGRGKTIFLVNAAYGACLARKNVLFITLEMSEEFILGRFYRRMLLSNRDEIRKDKEKAAKELQRQFRHLKNKVFVKFMMPGSLTVEGLERVLDTVEQREGVNIDVVMIDYVDKMKLPYSGSSEDRTSGLRTLTELVRYFGIRKNKAIMTVTQSNRKGLSASLITEEHISESYGKIEVSDIVLSLTSTLEETQQSKARLVVLKNREYGGVGTVIPVRTEFDKSLIEEYSFE